MALSKTAKYYRDNPKARIKHRKTSAKAQKNERQLRKEWSAINSTEKTVSRKRETRWIVLTKTAD